MSFVRLYHNLAVLFIIKCSVFISILTIGKELHMLSSCYGTNINNANVVRNKISYIHITEYPNDNYEHIFGYNDVDHQPSKLQLISALRIKETIRNKIPIDTQGCGIDRTMYISTDEYLEDIIELDRKYGSPINLYHKIKSTKSHISLAAEFKRASPSKGDINTKLDIVEQTLKYAEGGATVISVLTEFQHFKGTLQDLKKVRASFEDKYKNNPINRPAILRKDFIFDRYQILEARANGADTILLMVSILGVNQLKDLILYSRKLGMEPLVEVTTEKEMEIALDCGAIVIGVNSRNLHTFQLDMTTTSRLLNTLRHKNINWESSEMIDSNTYINNNAVEIADKANDICIAALSGIACYEDVQYFKSLGVKCCLIGETLMKSNDPTVMIKELLSDGLTTNSNSSKSMQPIIKTCGMVNIPDVEVALSAGSNMIGLIFAPSPRSIHNNLATAKDIVQVVRSYGERKDKIPELQDQELQILRTETSDNMINWYMKTGQLLHRITRKRPLVVGVFQNQDVQYINDIVDEVGLDIVQLHGEESPEFIDLIKVPCIKVIHIPTDQQSSDIGINSLLSIAKSFHQHALALLLDSRIKGTQGGGTGKLFDWSIIEKLNNIPVILAGGLNPNNIQAALKLNNLFGIDISSGIEIITEDGLIKPGEKDHIKIKLLFDNMKLK